MVSATVHRGGFVNLAETVPIKIPGRFFTTYFEFMAPSSTMTEKIMATLFLTDSQANDYFTREIEKILSLPKTIERGEINGRFASLLHDSKTAKHIIFIWNRVHDLSSEYEWPQCRMQKIYDMIIRKVKKM